MKMERSHWTNFGEVVGLQGTGRAVIKKNGKQIAIFRTESGLRACNNRCPHQGYPLSEGSLSDGCTLVCNWHGWAFDLDRGKTLTGGDQLRTYPVEERDGEIWIDLQDPPADALRSAALVELTAAMARLEYDRIARSIARFLKADGTVEELLVHAINWSHVRFEHGMGHSYAASADWLTLRGELTDAPAQRLVPLLEAIHHMSWDAMRGEVVRFTETEFDWIENSFLAAVESQNENDAIAYVNGAFASGKRLDDLEEAFTRAALSHYAGFGHAMIYLVKAVELSKALGEAVELPLSRSLVRYFVNASRDDLTPEFRDYANALHRSHSEPGNSELSEGDFVGKSVGQVLEKSIEAIGNPEVLYETLLRAAAIMMLQFDVTKQERTEQPISRNVGWLDFTHAITFANAVRRQCNLYPELWFAGLLQMACFIGRNAVFLQESPEFENWRVDDLKAFLSRSQIQLLDHGEGDPIYSSHILKLFTATIEEASCAQDVETGQLLWAAFNRFLNGRIKRRHVLRTASQAHKFVSTEG